jgi:hypothetical protein
MAAARPSSNAEPFCRTSTAKKEARMSFWFLIVIIVVVLIAFGGFRFSRR